MSLMNTDEEEASNRMKRPQLDAEHFVHFAADHRVNLPQLRHAVLLCHRDRGHLYFDRTQMSAVFDE